MPTPDPRLPGISTREAAGRLGVSPSTILRMIESGELKAEKITRPGGTQLRVLLDDANPASSDAAPIESSPTPEPRQDTSEAIQVALEPYVEAMAAERAERRRLAEENADLRERVGRAEAAAEARQTRADDLTAQLADMRKLRDSLAEQANERDDLAAQLAAERAAREQAEQRLRERRWWRWWT